MADLQPLQPRPPARAGDGVDGIDSPALVVDADAMHRNLRALADWTAACGLALRPHAKMHKSAHVGRLQMAAGAVGLCVQKVSEAEALVAASEALDAAGEAIGAPLSDILVTNEVLDARKLDRLLALAERIRLGVAVDSLEGVAALQAAVQRRAAQGRPAVALSVWVEIDVGQGRCGAPPLQAPTLVQALMQAGARAMAPADSGPASARKPAATPGLVWAGLQAYHGGAQHLRAVGARSKAVADAADRVRQAQAALAASGMPCPRVTGGGTGTLALDAASGVWDELQAGSYLFMDRDYDDNLAAPGAPRFEPALWVLSRVTSRAAGHAVIDAGHKCHALDSGPPRLRGALADTCQWRNGGDEHGVVEPRGDAEPAAALAALPALQAPVWLQPGHCDPTVNLHDHLVLVQGGLEAGRVQAVWPVHARGCVR